MSDEPQTAELVTRPAQSNGPPMPMPQYVQGFEGIATEPFPESARKVLAAEVNPDEVEIKPDGIVYLSHVAYRRLLTRAFGAGGWALAPRSPARRDGNVVLYHGALFCLGRFVSEAMGECKYIANNDNMTYASALEGARSDCLTRCCKDLGVATELWDKTWREWWQGKYAKKEWKEPTKPGDKGKYVWSKLDKAGKVMPSNRNVGGASPKEAAAVGGKTGDVSTAEQSASGSTGSVAAADPGEAPGDEELQAVRDAADKLSWAKPRAGAWLKDRFGVAKTTELTKQQASDALMLLLALQSGEKPYQAALNRLFHEKRVRA